MMIKTLLCVYLSLISVKIAMENDRGIEVGTVYLIGFHVELYVPYSESNIENGFCIGQIIKKDFFNSVLEKNKKLYYDASDVRAKIIFADNDIYFINREGISRHGEDFYLIDTDKFQKMVKIASCRNENGRMKPWENIQN
jgi:hypothetical protein